eukprot:364908-Chlamydomonas_euryale.AAC.1
MSFGVIMYFGLEEGILAGIALVTLYFAYEYSQVWCEEGRLWKGGCGREVVEGRQQAGWNTASGCASRWSRVSLPPPPPSSAP